MEHLSDAGSSGATSQERDTIDPQHLPAMEVDDSLLAGEPACCETARHVSGLPKPLRSSKVSPNAGDDSSWRMSDWRWDSKAFRAKPVNATETEPGSASCCRKRKSAHTTQPSACGGCKARSAMPFGLELNNSNNKILKTVSGSAMLCQSQQVKSICPSFMHGFFVYNLTYPIFCSTRR